MTGTIPTLTITVSVFDSGCLRQLLERERNEVLRVLTLVTDDIPEGLHEGKYTYLCQLDACLSAVRTAQATALLSRQELRLLRKMAAGGWGICPPALYGTDHAQLWRERTPRVCRHRLDGAQIGVLAAVGAIVAKGTAGFWCLSDLGREIGSHG